MVTAEVDRGGVLSLRSSEKFFGSFSDDLLDCIHSLYNSIEKEGGGIRRPVRRQVVENDVSSVAFDTVVARQ